MHSLNQNTILRVYERLTAEGLLERRHGDGTFVANRVPTGQMKAQRLRLRKELAEAVELAKTLGVDSVEKHQLLAASLDPLARRQFLKMIIDIAEPGKRTVLFSTHITSDMEHVADRVAILKAGKILWQGLLDELKEQTHVSLEESFLEMHRE